ncbi:MAG TPA: TonB-dependent receptor [Steroidobacteraceae bacterium]|jgi:outer membrane receptor protein involved in Fe transport|nr:TonB-dependent receptor [Steroidobacteraceae bacterium]
MSHFPRSILGAAIAAVLASPGIVWAQSADATLRGKAPADSDVTAKNVATGASRRTHTGSDGSYTLTGLPPGTYRVDAGPGTETVVTISVASTATLDLTAGSGAAEAPEAPMQEVTVTGRRLNEVRTSEIGATVSQDQIVNVPQMTRNFLEFADTIPGVVFEVDAKGITQIHGGAQNDNGVNVYIDGVGQKGYVRSGVSGQAGDTQGNPFPQLAIGEYKVITSNYKAEYDQLSSAAITALTRSGTNSFEGQAFGTYSQDSWRAKTPGELANGTKTQSETKEYGLAFGGPLMQDKMHFFFTYEAKRYQTPTTVVADGQVPDNVVAALPSDAAAQLGPSVIGFDEDLFFAKLDFEPNDVDRFELTAKVRDETAAGTQTGTAVAASAAIDSDNNDKRFELSWKHGADRWFNELQLTYEDAFFVPHINNSGQNGAVYTWLNGNDVNILAVDGSDPRAGQNKGQKGWAIADNITFTDIKWFGGDHTIKTGIKYKDVDLTAADSIPGNPVFYYNTTTAGAATIPWKAVFALPLVGFDSQVTSNDKQLGLFAQDDWTVNDHLTLNLGLRWDIEKNPSYLDFKTPQFLLDAFNTEISPGLTYGESLGLSTDPNVRLDINDYISTGNNRKAYDGEFQPRFGFAYDLGADQQHVIFGGAGRAYDRTLFDYLQLEQTKFALATSELRINTPDHPCTPSASCITWNPAFASDPNALPALLNGQAGEVNLINNDLKVPYSDQISLGMRNRLGDWNTSASISRIISKNGFVFTLGNRYPNGDFWQGRSQPWGSSPPGLAGVLLVGSNGIETRSTQVLLSVEKPFTQESHWGTTLAYTFTNAKQNRDINEHYAFDVSSINLYPFILSNAAAKHRVVATGTYSAPWGLMVAGKLTWSTPIPHTVASCLEAPATFPTGAACTAAAYVPDGNGYRALDLQVTKNFELGDLGSMYLRIDALNVTNARNLVDTSDVHSDDGLVISGRFNPDGNITGFPRTIRMSFGVKF